MLTHAQAMQRLEVGPEVLGMLISRGDLKVAEVGGEQMILADSIDLYETQRQDQAAVLDEMAELTEELALLGIY